MCCSQIGLVDFAFLHRGIPEATGIHCLQIECSSAKSITEKLDQVNLRADFKKIQLFLSLY